MDRMDSMDGMDSEGEALPRQRTLTAGFSLVLRPAIGHQVRLLFSSSPPLLLSPHSSLLFFPTIPAP
jgi:hypothetical protein